MKKKQDPVLLIWKYLLPVLGIGLIVLALADLWEAAAALVLIWFLLATVLSLINVVRSLRRGKGGDGGGEEQ
ncbi:hypothetical protein [uncultured Intestinimonas sp.]|uniref:hypothetical protein n=1 Tax=uncultured Intestinimonas sp. TaxID=1689265 RepID=UPI0025EC072F|nr:hypothetical protein [uncultured Intestinimonas sp.]